ncbi:MAG TPA: hypothetical protein VH866_02820 [Candidatus Deferrimicrobiaceae bacterium]|jgi:hypothetical protein
MELAFVSVLSVLLQLTAGFLALRLIRVSGRSVAWILISGSIFGMAIRRGFTIYRLFLGEPPHDMDLLYEEIGLVTSALMLAGVFYIAPIFESYRSSEKARDSLIRELQNALARVKALSGLLPICASCKKIRDDKGYWNQIETYIKERSEAEFSHSICPECRKKLYPDFPG